MHDRIVDLTVVKKYLGQEILCWNFRVELSRNWTVADWIVTAMVLRLQGLTIFQSLWLLKVHVHEIFIACF